MGKIGLPITQDATRGSVVIIEQQPHWMLVSKPSGMAIHGTGLASGEENLIDWLHWTVGIKTSPIGRLDKGASGLSFLSVLRADGEARAESLPELDKSYLAVVKGLTRKKGVIRRPLKDQRRRRFLDAVTRYRTLAHGPAESLVLVRIETGRKHQIRRHLSGIGHPIVGDRRYGGRRPRWSESERIWLHCHSARSESGDQYQAPLPGDWLDGCEHLGWDVTRLLAKLPSLAAGAP